MKLRTAASEVLRLRSKLINDQFCVKEYFSEETAQALQRKKLTNEELKNALVSEVHRVCNVIPLVKCRAITARGGMLSAELLPSRRYHCPVISAKNIKMSREPFCTCDHVKAYVAKYCGIDVTITIHHNRVLHFQDEVIKLQNLYHPRVIFLFGFIPDIMYDDILSWGLVTEYMTRGSFFNALHSCQQDVHMPLECRLRVVKDVAEGMTFLHGNRIIHGDLKSPNVFLDIEGRAKICGDFNLRSLLVDTTNTRGIWLAPETILNDISNESSDIYSFGAILWEVLTSEVPWDGLSLLNVKRDLSHGKTLVSHGRNQPDGWCNTFPRIIALVHQCLSHFPDDRPLMTFVWQTLYDHLSECPHAFICPISRAIMEDPVQCSDGHTYERKNIEEWLYRNSTSPMTGLKLESRALYSNFTLRNLIHEYKLLRYDQNG